MSGVVKTRSEEGMEASRRFHRGGGSQTELKIIGFEGKRKSIGGEEHKFRVGMSFTDTESGKSMA